MDSDIPLNLKGIKTPLLINVPTSVRALSPDLIRIIQIRRSPQDTLEILSHSQLLESEVGQRADKSSSSVPQLFPL